MLRIVSSHVDSILLMRMLLLMLLLMLKYFTDEPMKVNANAVPEP